MKTVLVARLISLLPTLATAQQRAANRPMQPKLYASVAGIEAPADNNAKTAKELRQAERETRQLARAAKAFSEDFKFASNLQGPSGKHEYVATFRKDAIKTTAWCNKGGLLLYTLLSYNGDRLPACEQEVLKKEFCDYKITQAEEVHEADVVVYLAHMENDRNIKLVTIRDGVTNIYRAYRKM